MSFKDLNELNKAFVLPGFKIEDEMVVGDITFQLAESETFNFNEVISRGIGAVLYKPITENHDRAFALVWKVDNKNRIIPAHITPVIGEAIEGEPDPRIIGDVVDVKITSLPNGNVIKGKVDTGATISSLHASRYKINGQQVEFVCPQLSNNVVTVPLADQQAVKSADGGTEYRPVIELNVKINDKVLTNQQFNLNDRSEMEHPMLLGQNTLEAGKFLIDPTINESVKYDLDFLASTSPDDRSREDLTEQLYKFIRESDITFRELFDFYTAENDK